MPEWVGLTTHSMQRVPGHGVISPRCWYCGIYDAGLSICENCQELRTAITKNVGAAERIIKEIKRG